MAIQQIGPFLFVGLVLAVIIAVVIFGWVRERKRRQAFQDLATRLNLRYCQRDPSIADRYAFLNRLHVGENRYAFNVLEGQYEACPVCVFDFHYETYTHDSKGNRETEHTYFSFFLLEQELDFPELRIYPESIFSKLGHMLGFEDIEFESGEFSRAFVVKSKDKKFAYDICHARMMECLLQHRDLSIEIERRCVSISFNKRLKPEEIEPRLRQLVEIRKLFPEYLYRA